MLILEHSSTALKFFPTKICIAWKSNMSRSHARRGIQKVFRELEEKLLRHVEAKKRIFCEPPHCAARADRGQKAICKQTGKLRPRYCFAWPYMPGGTFEILWLHASTGALVSF